MKFILIRVDKGDVWEITGTTVQPDDFVTDDTVMEVQKGVYDYIKTKLDTTQIQVSKKFKGNLIKEDLIETEYEPMMVYKSMALQRGREYLSTRLNVSSIFDYIDFVIANNTLLANGFAVTPDNKREMFIKIIESENKSLIDALETYTSTFAKLQVLDGWYKTFKSFEQKVYNALDKDEVDEQYAIFVQIFG